MVKNTYSSKLLTVSLLIIIAVILYYLVIDARIVYSHINKTNTEIGKANTS